MNAAATAIGIGGQLRRTVSGTGLAAAAAANQMQARPSPLGLVPPHRTQLPPRYLTATVNGGASASRWRRRMISSIAGVVTGVALIYVLFLKWGSPHPMRGYGIVIDAGSSGTRLHVFEYVAILPIPHVLPNSPSKKIKPGLSSFESNPSAAGESLQLLMEYAKGLVPEDKRATTPVYLMATAGLRLLDDTVQIAILESCRAELARSGFFFRPEWASVIPGMMEGVYAWVAANYAQGLLGKAPSETVGIIELGGASAQVAFVPDVPPPPNFRWTRTLGNSQYVLYSHSFLNFGQEAAMSHLTKKIAAGEVEGSKRKSKTIHPCLPRGYDVAASADVAAVEESSSASTLTAQGNFSECKKAALLLIKPEMRGGDGCEYSRCPMGNTYVPELRGKLLATENFVYTSEFFHLPTTATLSEMESAGRRYCNLGWEQLRKDYKDVQNEDLLKYCFSTSYIVSLLHDGLGVGMDDKQIQFTNKVGPVQVDWALGALIVQLHDMGSRGNSRYKLLFGTKFLLATIVVCTMLLVGIGAWSYSKLRKPALTTIYDLEKGRYFTTQVTRPYR